MLSLLYTILFSNIAVAESYLRTEYGVVNWIQNHPSPFTAPVNSIHLSYGLGQNTGGLEFTVGSHIWNGASYDQQPENIAVNNYSQGDSHTFQLLVGYRKRLFPVGSSSLFGFKGAIGVMGIPVLMHDASFDNLVVGQSWGLTASPNHRKVYIPVRIGVYYDIFRITDSIALGANIDAEYVVGWDLGIHSSVSLHSKF